MVSKDVIFNKAEAWTWSKGGNDKGKRVLKDEPLEDYESTPSKK